jgi:hypothetical protein
MQATTNKVTPELLAAAFDVEKVVVGDPLYTSSEEGQSTTTLAYIWGKYVIGAHVNPNPTNRTRTLGFMPTLYASNGGHLIERWYENSKRGEIVRFIADEDEVLVDANCGYLLTSVVS